MNNFETILQKLIDGTINSNEFSSLEQEMALNPEARSLYYSYVHLHQNLEFRLSRSQGCRGAMAEGMQGLAELRLKRQRIKAFKLTVYSTAAVILLSLCGMYYAAVQDRLRKPLSFASSKGAVFELTHEEGVVESGSQRLMHKGSKLELFQGSVELNFASGVRSIVTGPAEIVMKDHETLQMDRGRAWFDVPKNAVGFTVVSPDFKVVDLGTKFGVYSDPKQQDEVHVFEGEVEVSSAHSSNEAMVLAMGESAKSRTDGTFDRISQANDMFLVELPDQLPYIHFSFDQSPETVTKNTLSGAPKVTVSFHGERHFDSENSGQFGNALHLDGKTNFIETDWTGILGDAPRSVSFWIKLPNKRETEVGRTHVCALGWGRQNEQNNKWTIHFDTAKNQQPMLNISFGVFWYYCPDAILDDDQWHHVVVVSNNKKSNADMMPEVALYIDGELLPVYDASDEPELLDDSGNVIIDTQADLPLQIGTWKGKTAGGSHFLQAEMDELYIIEGAITERQIKNLMHLNRLDK